MTAISVANDPKEALQATNYCIARGSPDFAVELSDMDFLIFILSGAVIDIGARYFTPNAYRCAMLQRGESSG